MTDNLNLDRGALRVEYVPISQALEWEWPDNPKVHNIPKLKGSIVKHGFRDASIFDGALDPPGFAAGNGRIIAAHDLYKEYKAGKLPEVPPGIGVYTAGPHKGEWAVPIQFGIDSRSARMAEAFAVDHNNLTIVGFSDEEVALLWEPEAYSRILARLDKAEAPPESVSAETLVKAGTGEFLRDIQTLVESRGPAAEKPEPLEAKGEDPGPDVDQAAKLVKEYGVEVGQVWTLGNHKIAVGDSRDPAVLRALMGRLKASLLICDPPYGMGKESEGVANDNLYKEKLDRFQMDWWTIVRKHTADNGSAYLFGNPEDLWRLWYKGGLAESERLTFRNEIVWDKAVEGENPTMFVSGVPLESRRMYHPTERALFFMIGEQGFNNNQDNYWDGWEPIRSYLEKEIDRLGWGPKEIQEITGVGMYGHWFTKSQWTFIPEDHYKKLQAAAAGKAFVEGYGEKEEVYQSLIKDYEELKAQFYGTRAFFDNTHDRMTDVFRFARVKDEERLDHPTPKSLDLIERIIRSSSRKKDVIISPFLGTGTDLVGCERLGRRCRGIEIEPKWAAVSLRRWETMTGKKPVIVP